KAEWLEAYIHAHEVTFSDLNITSAWRGSGLQPFQPQTVIRAATLQPPTPATPQRPRTPTEHDIFEKVFINSSPPDFNTLQKANSILSIALNQGVLNTPTKKHIHKLADEAEKLNTRHILQQGETDNLRNIIQKRRAQNKGKRAVLKCQFHISTHELQSQVAEAEAATQKSKISTTPQVTTSTIDLFNDERVRRNNLTVIWMN
ncbi:hypothetical protein V491_00424, partial [Pseudogymnoascus sp. VKM F-3775]